jgi:hypothetical protein
MKVLCKNCASIPHLLNFGTISDLAAKALSFGKFTGDLFKWHVTLKVYKFKSLIYTSQKNISPS